MRPIAKSCDQETTFDRNSPDTLDRSTDDGRLVTIPHQRSDHVGGGVGVGGGAPAPLAVTKFSNATPRGWPGLGSLVPIADTGIDATHRDLAPALAQEPA